MGSTANQQILATTDQSYKNKDMSEWTAQDWQNYIRTQWASGAIKGGAWNAQQWQNYMSTGDPNTSWDQLPANVKATWFPKGAPNPYVDGGSGSGGGGGGGWGSLAGYSWSTGQNQSIQGAFSGLAPQLQNTLFPIISSTVPQLNNLITRNIQGPSQDIYNWYVNTLTPMVNQWWTNNINPVMRDSINNTINSLAQQGVLDSSTAGKTLGNVISSNLSNLANLAMNLQQQGVNQALQYPLNASQIALGLLNALSQMGRISASSGSYTGSTLGGSYNPSPLVSLITSLFM